MKKHIKFPKIDQFRTTVSNINRRYNFIGLDENGDAIYDHSLPKPTITFKGSVKLHGTNAGVCHNNLSGMWAQSRDNIITPEQDNAGFAFFAEGNKSVFQELFEAIATKENIDMNTNTVSIFGEWAGGSIQKTVALNNLPKSFFIFGVKISPIVDVDDEELVKNNPAYWVDHTYLKSVDDKIFNINDFETYTIDIDFNMPQLIQNKLSELTIAVEEECPVGKAFGFSGIGEGIVWTCDLKGERYIFKVKGEKHSVSKVKTLAPVDVEKLESIQEFIEYAVTENRFQQGLDITFPNEQPIDIKKMGDLIRWVVSDVMKEEMDVLVENNIEPKEVNKYISTKVRNMFLNLPV